ncbi:MAG: PD40 domain-containing protein [Bryobacterales bacterium]|nr:PD40 domain-containing protein [Bryobacterales bacterium]
MSTMRIPLLLIAATLLAADNGYNLFQRGLAKERADADPRAAIRIYEQVLQDKSVDRKLAAQALLRMAECHQKLGDAEARKIYERLLREYPDQTEAATTARARLGAAALDTSGIVTRQVWKGRQVAIYAAVSPDGQAISYVDQTTGNLDIHDLAAKQHRRLTVKTSWETSSEYAEESTFSPDGRQVAYAWFNGEGRYDLRIAQANASASGSSKVLYSNPEVIWLAPKDWSTDGKWIAALLERSDGSFQIGLVDAAGGSLRVLKSVDWDSMSAMRFSKDSKLLAFDQPAREGSPDHDVFVLAVDGSSEFRAVEHPADDRVVGWTPDGSSLLFTSDRTGTPGIYSVAVTSAREVGKATQLKADVGQAAMLGLTRSGVLYFAMLPGSRDFLKATVDFESAKVIGSPVPAVHRFLGTNYQPDWSPDGGSLSYTSYRLRRRTVLEIQDVATAETRTLQPKLRYFNFARWAPDGASLIAQGTDLKGRQGVYRIDARTGNIEAIALAEPTMGLNIPQWSPDGKKVFYIRRDQANKKFWLMERELAVGKERQLAHGSGLRWFAVSPDGQRLACSSDDGAVFFLAVETGERRELIGPGGGFSAPAWTPDGRFVVLRKSGTLWVVPAAGGEPRNIDLGLDRILDVRIHPDGKQIALMTRNDTLQEVWAMENLLGAARVAKR